MKRIFVLFALVVLFGWDVSISNAASYFSGNLGVVTLDDLEFGGAAEGIIVDGKISTDAGIGINAAFGHAYDNNLRAEVELGYRTNEVDKMSIAASDGLNTISGSAGLNGDIAVMAIMTNLFYDFKSKNDIGIDFFIGAGLGFANVEFDFDEIGKDDDNVFAYQAATGLAFSVTEKTKIDLQYRYFSTKDPKIAGTRFDYVSHNTMIGLRYSF